MLNILAMILIVGLMLFAVKLYSSKDMSEREDASHSDSEISSVEQLRAARARYSLKEDIKDLKSRIRRDICSLYDERIPDLKNANAYAIERLEELFDTDIKTESQLDYVKWLYNDGNLRTDNEIFQRQADEENEKFLKSGKYAYECSMYRWVFGLGGFALGFFLPYALCAREFGGYKDGLTILFGGSLGLIGGCFGAYVGIMLAHTVNIDNGRSNGVPEDNPLLKKEKFDRNAGLVAGIFGIGSIGRHIHKSAKDISNVDSWKQMK